MLRSQETIAALATPVGTSALALLRISGPETRALIENLLGRAPLPRRAIHADYRDRSGVVLDDVVITFFAGPHSYTGEDTAEITCHGNPFIAQKILEDLHARGCRAAGPGEFTQRAFLQGRMDLSQAEAVMDLIRARGDRALKVANEQLRGALGRRMELLIDSLLAVLARVEAYIDFPEEGLPQQDVSWIEKEATRLRVETKRLLGTSRYGEVLRDGIKTVIVGRPNVGKSSLLNRLVGKERALVSPEPGTTRDFIEERVIVGAHCLRLIDTAGLNLSPAPLEQMGMDRTWEQLAEADLVVCVTDATAPDDGVTRMLGSSGKQHVIKILNKCDLLDDPGHKRAGDEPILPVSALTGVGMEELLAAIEASAERFRSAADGEDIAVSARHAQALQDADAAIERALGLLGNGGPVELLASELRGALSAYGEITGRVDNERMLDHLFATFCIGK